jgi:hypothetical protein
MSAQVVFMDSCVPDIQARLAGVKPGDLALVREPSGDDVLQITDITDIPAANDLTGLSSISIAGHGSSSIPPATSF